MKMEPVKSFEAASVEPSLRNLSYALRHPENDPVGFIWDYRHWDGCAKGLAECLWPGAGIHWKINPGSERDRIFVWGGHGDSVLNAIKLILFGRRRSKVADDIDAYLARQEA